LTSLLLIGHTIEAIGPPNSERVARTRGGDF